MGNKKYVSGIVLLVLAMVITTASAPSMIAAATPPFEQGQGYEAGKYDLDAVQPTAYNWTRQSRFSGSPHFDEIWSFQTGGAISSSPVIGADGTIYVGSSDRNIYALDPTLDDAHRVKWSFQTGVNITSSPAISADGTVYIGSYDGKLYALDPSADDANRVKWSFDTEAYIHGGTAIGADGTVYVGARGVYALDPNADDANRMKWRFQTDSFITSTPAIGADGTVYVSSTGGTLYALDPAADDDDERVKWSVKLSEGIAYAADPAIGADGTIYVGTIYDGLYALDPTADHNDDRVKWSFRTGSHIESSAAIGADGTVYIGFYDGKVYALDPTADDAHRVKWLFETGEPIIAPATIGADGTVYIGSIDRKLYALDPAADDAHRVKWFFETGGVINSGLVIGLDGTVYFGSYDGKLYALGTNPPAAPANLQATAGNEKVTLTWDPVNEAHGYRVYHFKGLNAPANADDWTLVNDDALIMDTTYDVEPLSAGELYWFAVQAVRKGGSPSDLSAADSAIPTKISVIVVRPPSAAGIRSGNANLKTFEVWADGQLVALAPSFRADMVSYTARTKANQVEIKAIAEHAAAKVTWQGQALGDGIQIDLQPGETEVSLIVQAENGARKAYTVVIERMSHTDLAGHWAESYLQRAIAAGIVNGYPDGTFKPNDPVTRAEFTVMLISALQPTTSGGDLPFFDADRIGNWAQQTVAQAVQLGIIAGYDDGHFRPEAKITRAEIAVMIARALQLTTESGTATGFADDADIPQWAKGAVAAIRQLGLIEGRGGNRFVPNETATRAEATVMVLRILPLVQESPR